MRVIAGSAKHLQLKTIKSDATRPTTDRIKETLFNMLQYDVEDSVFLDLFSGSGAIAIEALSRGAKRAYLVENSREAITCINDNLKFTKLDTNANVMNEDVFSAIKKLEIKNIQCDIIFMDPPYNMEFEKKVLNLLKDSSIIHKDTIIIVEASLDTDFSYAEEYGFEVFKEKRYKTNKHMFLCKSL